MFRLGLALITGCVASVAQSQGDPTPAWGPGPRPFAGHPYEKHYEWKDWRIEVREVPGDGSALSWYSVSVSRVVDGAETPKYKSVFDADARIQRTWLADVRRNGWPDLVIFTSSGGGNAPGSLRILECLEKGFHRVKPPVAPDKLLKGYRGGDDWDLKEGSLVRRFPLYGGEDGNTYTGAVREVRFKWEKGRFGVKYRTIDPKGPVGEEAPTPAPTPEPDPGERPAAAPTISGGSPVGRDRKSVV